MSVECFIDTNVFIYHLDVSYPRKNRIAERIVCAALVERNACISFQVVQECLDTALHKARIALSPEAAREYLDAVLLPLLLVPASAALYHRAVDIQERWRFSFHDSLIVAGALSAGCSVLWSEDLQDGQRIESPTVQNPFRA